MFVRPSIHPYIRPSILPPPVPPSAPGSYSLEQLQVEFCTKANPAIVGGPKKPFSMMEKQRKKAWTMSHLLHTATLAMHARRSIDRRRAIELHMYSLTHSVNDELLGVLVYYDVDEAGKRNT